MFLSLLVPRGSNGVFQGSKGVQNFPGRSNFFPGGRGGGGGGGPIANLMESWKPIKLVIFHGATGTPCPLDPCMLLMYLYMFDLFLLVPVNNFSVMLGQVFLG